jgi:hypothetical protein
MDRCCIYLGGGGGINSDMKLENASALKYSVILPDREGYVIHRNLCTDIPYVRSLQHVSAFWPLSGIVHTLYLPFSYIVTFTYFFLFTI